MILNRPESILNKAMLYHKDIFKTSETFKIVIDVSHWVDLTKIDTAMIYASCLWYTLAV
jgi:hypothetical protein